MCRHGAARVRRAARLCGTGGGLLGAPGAPRGGGRGRSPRGRACAPRGRGSRGWLIKKTGCARWPFPTDDDVSSVVCFYFIFFLMFNAAIYFYFFKLNFGVVCWLMGPLEDDFWKMGMCVGIVCYLLPYYDWKCYLFILMNYFVHVFFNF